MAAAAGDQVRVILDAAEQAAAQIRAAAEAEANRIRSQAVEEATGIRSQASSEVSALVESIRVGLTRVRADVELLAEKLAPASPGEPAATPVRASTRQAEAPQAATPAEATARADELPVPTREPEPAAAADADLEGARLVALNMALDGAERSEVERYLSENFSISDRGALLDEVYASLGG
jgi:cell division septum initiation protein DivIVA